MMQVLSFLVGWAFCLFVAWVLWLLLTAKKRRWQARRLAKLERIVAEEQVKAQRWGGP